MKVAIIQLNSTNDKEKNLSTVESLVNEICTHHAPHLITLPEMFNFMGGGMEQKKLAAESLNNGESIALLKNIAKKFKVYVHGGSICERDDGRYFNTTPVIDTNGELIAVYRKLHLFNFVSEQNRYHEASMFSSGKKIVAYTLDSIQVAAAICFDLRFPKLFSAFKEQDCKIIVVPSAFTYETGKAHWEILLRARAIETQAFVIAPAQTGIFYQDGEQRANWGHAMVVDPWGNVMTSLKEAVGYRVVTLDFDYLDSIRKKLPVKCSCDHFLT